MRYIPRGRIRARVFAFNPDYGAEYRFVCTNTNLNIRETISKQMFDEKIAYVLPQKRRFGGGGERRNISRDDNQ